MMKKLLFFLCLLISTSAICQVTAIPDENFEEALIDQGIDSDDTINGQVLTSDIEKVVELDVSYWGIEDLTGLENFTALEILDVTANYLTTLDVSNNVELKELYCGEDSVGFTMNFSSLDFSNNVNLEILYGENLDFEHLNVKNGNNAILTVTFPCEFEGEPCELTKLNCVMVDDEAAANNHEPPYSNWFIQADYVYSEDCTLDSSSEKEKVLSIYPNPVQDRLILKSPRFESSKLTLAIYTIQGKAVVSKNIQFENETSIDVSDLSSGMYFISIEDKNGKTSTQKFMKF